jgi:hypothetical protein
MTTTSTTPIFRVLTCPLEPHFHFYNSCPIKCLYNSKKCSQNCIQLGTSKLLENKSLSPSEILFYKGSELPKTSVKTINGLKKEGIAKIQNLYALNFYLEYLRNTQYEFRMSLVESKFDEGITSTRVLNLLNRYPYNVKVLKITIPDLVLLCTKRFFDEFKIAKRVSEETNYLNVLGLKSIKLKKLRKVLSKYLKLKEIYHEFSEKENQSITND